jgi:hypothetical protein
MSVTVLSSKNGCAILFTYCAANCSKAAGGSGEVSASKGCCINLEGAHP